MLAKCDRASDYRLLRGTSEDIDNEIQLTRNATERVRKLRLLVEVRQILAREERLLEIEQRRLAAVIEGSLTNSLSEPPRSPLSTAGYQPLLEAPPPWGLKRSLSMTLGGDHGAERDAGPRHEINLKNKGRRPRTAALPFNTVSQRESKDLMSLNSASQPAM